MPDFENIAEALGIVVILLMGAVPWIIRALARKNQQQRRNQAPQQQQQRQERPQQQRQERPQPAGQARPRAADPFEELRRRIEAAQRQRQQQRQPTRQQPQAETAPQARPVPPQYAPIPAPQQRQAPRPAPAPQASQQVAWPAQSPRPVKVTRRAVRTPVQSSHALGSIVQLSPRDERRRQPSPGGWQRIDKLPPLKRAIVMAEILGKPRADKPLF